MTATNTKPLDLAQFDDESVELWHSKPIESGEYRISTEHDALCIATVHRGPFSARLIAAAPALLAECRRLRDDNAKMLDLLAVIDARLADTGYSEGDNTRHHIRAALEAIK